MIFDLLASQGIKYERVDHPAVYTCEEARRLVPAIAGAETKNLFLRDAKARRHFLVSVLPSKTVDLKQLDAVLGVKELGFASKDRLAKYLKIDPGSVTLLAVVNDLDNSVEVIVDESIWQERVILCHPLVNTSTISLRREDLDTFLRSTGHVPRVVVFPNKEEGRL